MKYFIQTKESIFGKTAAKAGRNSDKTANAPLLCAENLI